MKTLGKMLVFTNPFTWPVFVGFGAAYIILQIGKVGKKFTDQL